MAVPDRGVTGTQAGERWSGEPAPGVGRRIVRGRPGLGGRRGLAIDGLDAADDEKKLAARPGADRLLRGYERRARQRPPRTGLRVVRGATGPRVAAAAAAPADQLAAGPDRDPFTGRGLRQPAPRISGRVVSQLRAAPDKQLAPGPGGLAAAVARGLRRARKPAPGMGRRVVSRGDVLRADERAVLAHADAGDEQLLARPGGRQAGADLDRRRR